MIGLRVFIVHLVFFALVFVLYRMHKLNLDAPALVIAACLPIVGEVIILMLSQLRSRGLEGSKEGDIPDLAQPEDQSVSEELDANNEENAVPLEDALIVDDTATRREAMVQALLGDSESYISTIASARNNDDSEVSHYASTALAEFSHAYEKEFRELMAMHKEDPDDMSLLAAAIVFMERYLASDLLQGQLLLQMRGEYLHLLEEKHRKAEALADDRKLVKQLLNAGRFDEADRLLSDMEETWPDSQDVWCSRLRYCVITRNADGVHTLVDRMRKNTGFKTDEVKEAMEFWGGSMRPSHQTTEDSSWKLDPLDYRHSAHPIHWYRTVLLTFGILCAIAFLVYAQIGRSNSTGSSLSNQMLDSKEVDTSHVKVASTTDCLVVYDSNDMNSLTIEQLYQSVFAEMRVGFDEADVSSSSLPDLTRYRKVVVTISNYQQLRTLLPTLRGWVSQGGQLLLGCSPWGARGIGEYADLLGIVPQSDYQSLSPEDFTCTGGFMVGGGQSYQLPRTSLNSLVVSLSTGRAWASTTKGLPLVWTNDFGTGRVCVNNLNLWGKIGRGVCAQAYTLLGTSCVYPVIDGSIYYIDDCPAPAPTGTSPYLSRDYGMTTSQFYSNVWWPDINRLAEEHDISYTGALIETYDSRTDGSFDRPTSAYGHQYYGSLLFAHGGELALHGYNHQPLVDRDTFYTQGQDYGIWSSPKAMSDSLKELQTFAHDQFDKSDPVVYVPPSNILSRDGREVIAENGAIRAIASVYLPGGNAYDQEFTVSADGIVEIPRVTSGEIASADEEFLALSELNLHYVNSHFIHPDDVTDEARGADKGWAAMRNGLEAHMTWVDQNAPGIRHLTGSGMAGAVQRYAMVTPQVSEDDSAMSIHLDGYLDGTYLFVRLSDSKPASVTGGTLRQVTDSLYLLDARTADVTIQKEAP